MQEFRSQSANLQKLQQKQGGDEDDGGRHHGDTLEGGGAGRPPREWSFAMGMLYSVSLLTTVGE